VAIKDFEIVLVIFYIFNIYTLKTNAINFKVMLNVCLKILILNYKTLIIFRVHQVAINRIMVFVLAWSPPY